MTDNIRLTIYRSDEVEKACMNFLHLVPLTELELHRLHEADPTLITQVFLTGSVPKS